MRVISRSGWFIGLFLSGMLLTLISPSTSYSRTLAPSDGLRSGNVVVRVKSAGSENPIPGAQVTIHSLGLSGVSNLRRRSNLEPDPIGC